MPNVTMSIDEELLKSARKIAIEKNTTVSDMVRSYLTNLVKSETIRREYVADELERLFNKSTAHSQGIRLTRDALHDR
ncbi:DUF6364 family protein [Gracilinema caldarium]|uniref:CopG-like DNA-binding protein n=1 Tax=Gracilinema caldarium (strain ATCC 51460 / DSM 7334 / H1) TaxID=744872 RepID=F8F2B7_GRAC1|nr:DUF6364 family protein [Gracilinema caldarium]AEJ20899.1 CopG-like DNA-binding protein [Gracilinema caldarium DSM 7334]